MSIYARTLALLACASAMLLAPIGATELKLEVDRIDIRNYPQMVLTCNVFDPSGRVLRGLTSAHFRLFENAIRCRKLAVAVDVTPISVVLALDSSGSMVSAVNHLKLAASQFVRLMDPQDEVMLIDFDNEPRVISHFTNNAGSLVAAIGTLEAYGATAFYDSVYKGVLEVRSRKGRRAVVAMTDGQDQNAAATARLSRHTLKDVLRFARSEKVPVYTVGLGKYVDPKALQQIAKASGGSYAHAPLGRDLEKLYVNIARSLKNRVRIGYRSPVPKADGKWRTVQVRCAKGTFKGAGSEKYRPPGRYMLEIAGQGYERDRIAALAKTAPDLHLLGVRLKTIFKGDKKKLDEWLSSYFKR